MEYTALFLYAVTCLSDTGIPRNSLYLNLFLLRINHGKTKSARIQKRNVFSTDKNEM